MSPFQTQYGRIQASREYANAQAYAESADMRLSRDSVNGYWLHFDGRMRFVRFLSEVRGLVDYLNEIAVE